MKKILTLLCALIIFSEGFAQTYYSWDFNTLTSSTFPTGFVTWDLDGQTVDTTQIISALNSPNGWVVFPATSQYYGAAAAASLFFNTNVAANRWLVTADMTIPTGVADVSLQWNAASAGAEDGILENYNVEISTTDSNTTSFTNILTVTGETGEANHILPLAAYAGQTIRVAFVLTTLNGVALNINTISLINLPSESAQINDIEVYEHNYIGNPVTITGIMTNSGFNSINDFTLNYSINGAAPVTSTATGQGLITQQSYYYTHGVPFSPTTAGTYNIAVWFSQLNGTGAVSDTSTLTIFYYPQVAGLVKNVVVEEMTGAGCPFCPGGALELRDIANSLPYAIPVAIHSGDIDDIGDPADLMQINDGETVIETLVSDFPSAMVDRLYSFDNQAVAIDAGNLGGNLGGIYTGPSDLSTYNWDTLAAFRNIQATPVNVSLSDIVFDSTQTTNNLTVTVNATFLNGLSQGTYNLNLYVVEDSLLTTGQGYNQDNGFYSQAAGQTTNYCELYGLPKVLIDNGVEYSHNHVLRAMVGGPWGTTGQIPSAPTTAAPYSHTYTTTISPSWRYNYVKLIGLVQEYNDNPNMRTILNASETKLLQAPNGIKETSELNKLSVYPNPAATMATVELDMKADAMVTISIVDMMGQTVVVPGDNLLNAGIHSVNIPVGGLATGLYMVKVTVNGEVNTIPLSVTAK
jgi:hypothetical protein